MSSRTPQAAIQQRFNGQRRLRPWSVTHFGGVDAAKSHPLACCRFRPDEGGTLSTTLAVQLAPVNGYMRSNAYVEVFQVAVPYQAIEKLELDADADAGVTEMTRRRLEAGAGIGLEDENTISKACFVHPKSIGGVKKVSKTVRLAYLAAVNHMRKWAYFNAQLVDKSETAILPAILSANVLKRFNAVLDPEKLVDGAVQLTGELPVKGIGFPWSESGASTNLFDRRDTEGETYPDDNHFAQVVGENNDTYERTLIVKEDPDNPGHPKIYAKMAGANGTLTLRDMMKSKKLDLLIRDFAGMIKADPIHGEEKVARAIYGLSVDYGADCQVLYHKTYELQPVHQRPTDGASINDVSAHFALQDRFATLVPRSELGMQVVTIMAVKPLEVLSQQPDPAQTEKWELVNRVHDELELDEQLVTRADVESDLLAADEDQPVFWVGHNQLKHDYSTQGPNEQQTFNVEMKSSMWVYPVPTSVTPQNVNYPDNIDMYPFFNWNGNAAEYTIHQVAAISTSLAKGPNPVERIQLFSADPSLIELPA